MKDCPVYVSNNKSAGMYTTSTGKCIIQVLATKGATAFHLFAYELMNY